jgi:tetratricopeptide (TPR) repeat protein
LGLRRTHGTWWIALAIAAATVVVYLPVLGNGFVNYDDDLYILNNPHVQRGLGPETLAWAFTTFRGANWFPLTWLSWAADFAIYGRNPAGFHLTSLILHVANAVVLYVAFEGLTGARWRSALVAAVFALHPLHVESVAWAAARKDVLSGLFAMLTLLAYERFTRRGWRFYPFVFACLALGLVAKPTLVTWPFVLLLLDEWPLLRLRGPAQPARWDRARLRGAVAEKLPLFALVAAISAVAVASQSYWGTVQDLERLPVSLRIGNALTSYVAYVGDAFWPTGLAVFYPHPGHALETWRAVAAGCVLLAASVGALLVRRRHPEVAVGWFWYLGVLVPVIGLVQVGQAARADRYTYLPLIGLSIPVVWAAATAASRGRTARALAVALALAAVAALGVSSHAQARRWRDSLSLFRHALAVTENNHVAHINVGVALYNDGLYGRAARHLEQALRLAPASATAAGMLGDVRLAQERPEDALQLYRRALRVDSKALRWREGIGNALLDLERGEEAVRSYRRALAIKPDAARIHGNLCRALHQLERYAEARAACEEALRLNPNLAEVHGNLGATLVELGEIDLALSHFDRALALRPELALVHAHTGKLLAARGEFDPALAHLAEAVRLEPANARFRAIYARALDRAGRGDEAMQHYLRALAEGERGVVSLVGLARLSLAAGRVDEAIALAEEAAGATERRSPPVLALLGEAYAGAGRFDDAVRVTEAAAVLAEAHGRAEILAAYRARIAAYREGRRP